MAGVLAQRQSGLGWGQIAKNMGVKLGSVVSASKTDKVKSASNQADKSSNAHKSSANSDSASSHSQGSNKGGNAGGGGGKK